MSLGAADTSVRATSRGLNPIPQLDPICGATQEFWGLNNYS